MFDAYEDLELESLTDGHLRTRGLAERGHPEFELVGVPSQMRGDAIMLLNRAADSAMQRRPFEAGRPWASRFDDGFLVATRVLANGEGVLRLVDVDAESVDSPAKTAICATAVSRARLLYSEHPDVSALILKNALSWFPGEIGEGLELQNDELCNQSNSLAWLARSKQVSDPAEKLSLFRGAIERSRALAMAELGGPYPDALPNGMVVADVARLVEALLAGSSGLPQRPPGAGAGVAFLMSPALRLGPDGALAQSLAIGPVAYREYFYGGRTPRALRDAAVHEHVATIFDAWSSDPRMALVLSAETTHDVYEGGYRFDDATPTRPFEFQSAARTNEHIPLLSRILAQVAREIAAGASLEESAARWGIANDPNAAAAASNKLRALAAREERIIREAYGFS
jgi:hypothetical protein